MEPANLAKGLLFDFDGTLYGDSYLWSEIIVETLSQFGITTKPEDALDRARQLIQKEGGINGTIRISGVAADLARDHGVLKDDDVKARFFEILDQHMDQDGPTNNLLDLLRDLQSKQFKMGIVTFVRKPRITRRLAVWNIANFFGATITPEDVPDFKPSPAPFLTAMGKLNVRPAECIVVGDEPVDMIGGKKAGATTVGLPQGFFSRQELEMAGADHVLNSLRQLPEYIHEQNLV